VPKFRRATTPNSEVIGAPLLHFKPIFDPPLKKFVRGPPSPVGGALVKLGHSLARVKSLGTQHPLGAEIWSSEKCVFGGYNSTSRSPRKNRSRQNKNPILNIFIRFRDIRHRTSKSSEIGPNFACFWPLKFFWGVPPEILDQHYKIGPSTDHRAKFHAGRPTHLGDLALTKKITRNLGQSPTWVRPAP